MAKAGWGSVLFQWLALYMFETLFVRVYESSFESCCIPELFFYSICLCKLALSLYSEFMRVSSVWFFYIVCVLNIHMCKFCEHISIYCRQFRYVPPPSTMLAKWSSFWVQRREMSAQIRDKLNNMYGQLSGNVHVMNQVKVTRRGVPGMPLNERNCKAMLHKVFSELKTLCECINLGKALAK